MANVEIGMTGIGFERLPAVVGVAEVKEDELAGLCLGESALSDIDAAHVAALTVALALQLPHQMPADEAVCSTYQSCCYLNVSPGLLGCYSSS